MINLCTEHLEHGRTIQLKKKLWKAMNDLEKRDSVQIYRIVWKGRGWGRGTQWSKLGSLWLACNKYLFTLYAEISKVWLINCHWTLIFGECLIYRTLFSQVFSEWLCSMSVADLSLKQSIMTFAALAVMPIEELRFTLCACQQTDSTNHLTQLLHTTLGNLAHVMKSNNRHPSTSDKFRAPSKKKKKNTHV